MVVRISKEEDYNIIASDFLEQTIRSLNKTKKKVFIALSGGSTPLPILEILRKRELNWGQLYFFMVDERVVPLNHPDSNYGAICKIFFDHIPSQSFSMVQDGKSTNEAIMMFESAMHNLMDFNAEGFPIFDLILLGMGDDGHTASLFPRTSALEEKEKAVVVNDVPKLNTYRVTLTYPTILSANEIIVLIKGQVKKQIYEEIISNDETSYPMQKVISERNDIKWILED